jgi:enoyl-CoA hydratase/carnithine racemase
MKKGKIYMKDGKNLLVVKKGAICTVIINNPRKRNALTPECLFDIARTFDDFSHDQALKAVILRGAGQEAFSAGADISSMPTREDSAVFKENGGGYSQAFEAIQRFPLPVIAMLYGYTLGAGCILAMGCDIRLASKNVKMGIPTSRMGLLTDYRVFRRFLTVLGYSAALEIFLTGQHYEGQECLMMGLVNHLLDHDQLEPYTYKLAEEIIHCAPLSLRGSKYILTRIAENPILSLEELETFSFLSRQATESDDHEEAKRAFKEKRKPRFTGR